MDREDRAKKVMFQRVALGIFAVLVVIAIVVGIRSCAKKDDSAKVTTVKATKAPTTKETTTKKVKEPKVAIMGECYVEDFENYCKDLLPKKTLYVYKIGVLTGALINDKYLNYQGNTYTAEERVALYKPDQLFFLVGMNETENDTPQITVKHFDTMIKDIKGVSPNLKAVICSLPPVAKDGLDGYGTNAQIRNYNEKIKAYCNKTDGVDYLDIRDIMEDENGKLSKEANPGDGAHWQISTTKEVAKRIKEKSDELKYK